MCIRDRFTSLYMVANYATMGSLSLYFVLSLAYELTKIYAEEEELNMNPLNGALLALMAFIMTVPQIIFDGGMMKAVGSLKAVSYTHLRVITEKLLCIKQHTMS